MENRSNTRFRTLAGAVLLLGAAPVAFSQQTTERYIPIGASPGVSGTHSYIGRIVSIGEPRTVTFEETAGERHTVTITDDTIIWLDRSQKRLTSNVGDYADCQVGRRAEIRYRQDDPSIAAWIKLADN